MAHVARYLLRGEKKASYLSPYTWISHDPTTWSCSDVKLYQKDNGAQMDWRDLRF